MTERVNHEEHKLRLHDLVFDFLLPENLAGDTANGWLPTDVQLAYEYAGHPRETTWQRCLAQTRTLLVENKHVLHSVCARFDPTVDVRDIRVLFVAVEEQRKLDVNLGTIAKPTTFPETILIKEFQRCTLTLFIPYAKYPKPAPRIQLVFSGVEFGLRHTELKVW